MLDLDYFVHQLKKNEVVALPTDGVFGLFAIEDSQEAIEKIYELKKRKWNKKLCSYLPDLDFLNREEYIGMTYIFDGVGYRCSKIHPSLDYIVSKTGTLVGTSCNLSQTPPITRFNYIDFSIEILKENPIYGLESTILSLDNNSIIRNGLIDLTSKYPIYPSDSHSLDSHPLENTIYAEISLEISSHHPINFSCDQANKFWQIIHEEKTLNFQFSCSCYICNLCQSYVHNIKEI